MDQRHPSGRFAEVRAHTERLAAPLTEDQTVQSMPDVSPTKWHRAHVTWFFETFVLADHEPGFSPYLAEYAYLFSSYYESVGPRYPRPQRGLVSRPGAGGGPLSRRRRRPARLLLASLDGGTIESLAPVLELGFHHEQQHQGCCSWTSSTSCPATPTTGVRRRPSASGRPTRWAGSTSRWARGDRHDGPGFRFDNEEPQHRVWLEPFRLADRLVTNGEWLEFVADGGYRRHELWLSPTAGRW